ncbi:hypothetical protein BD779DRAFT_781844 [Infundibulicybe gibba]|nr:hypothetical protein BD779DRAFT_781844 [Infundibulicybe gibba]
MSNMNPTPKRAGVGRIPPEILSSGTHSHLLLRLSGPRSTSHVALTSYAHHFPSFGPPPALATHPLSFILRTADPEPSR